MPSDEVQEETKKLLQEVRQGLDITLQALNANEQYLKLIIDSDKVQRTDRTRTRKCCDTPVKKEGS